MIIAVNVIVLDVVVAVMMSLYGLRASYSLLQWIV